MQYTAEFIGKVKTVYPDRKALHLALEQGCGYLVGRYLDEFRHLSMSPAEIVQAFEQGREQDVLEAAKQASKRTMLYAEWSDLCR